MTNNASHAQEYLYEYKRILVDPTSTNNQINSVAKDKNGMIWLGASLGLFRFDGYTTEKINYITDKANQHDVHINKIACVGDTLLIGDNEGIHAINCFSHQPIDIVSRNHDKILGLVADAATGVWWLNEKGMLTNYFQNKQRSVLLPIGSDILRAELLSDGHDLWMALTFAIGHKTIILNKAAMAVENKHSITGIGDYVKKIRKSATGEIKLIAAPQAYSRNGKTKRLGTLNGYGEQLSDLLEANNETFTTNNDNQLYHYIKSDSGLKKTLIPLGANKPENIYELYDINRSIYAATSNGLVIVKYTRNLFQTIFFTYNESNNSFLVPRGIAEDDNYIYLGTYLKLFRFNRKTGKTETILNDEITTRSLLKDADTLWMGTEGGGILQFTLTDKKLKSTPLFKKTDWNTIICLAHLDKDRIIAGGLKTLLLFDKRNHVTSEITVKVKGVNICENRVNQIIVLNKNKILIATGLGIFVIDEHGTILKSYSQQLKERESLNTFCIIHMPDNTVWAGTENGIFQLDENGRTITHLTRNEGLSGNMIVSLLPDQNNRLWAATFTGLSAINLATNAVNNYYKEDGLPDNEFNHSSYMLGRDGSIVLGSVNGFIRFDPDKVNLGKNDDLNVHISKIESGNQQQKAIGWLENNDNQTPIKLGKGINYVKLQFFIAPIDVFRNAQFEYKIEGVHPEWISMGNSPVLHIDNFRPGKYKLIVRAITGSGSRNIFTKTYPLLVQQYFYNATWFYITILSAILLLIILYLIAVLQRNKKIMTIRQHISQDLHDDIGGYLTGITMNLELMQKNRGSENRYYNTIQTLGRNAMLALKDSLWSLDSKSDTAQELWDRVKNMASETYENLDIDFQFKQIEGLDKVKLSLREKSHLIYIIKECMTNSIKYGDRKLVKFLWEKSNGRHTIKISNRMGQQDADFKIGNGLFNIENRMKTIKGTAAYKNENDHFLVILHLNFLP